VAIIAPPGPPRARFDALWSEGFRPVICRGDAISNGLSSGTNQNLTYRWYAPFPVAARNLALVYSARQILPTGETSPADAFTIAVAIESSSGKLTRATFDGHAATSKLLNPGELVVSDPVPVSVAAGDFIYVRTYVSVDTLGKKWPNGLELPALRQDGITEGIITGSFLATNPGAWANASGMVCPQMILGQIAAPQPTVAIVGSSTGFGHGDTIEAPGYSQGYLSRAFYGAGIPVARLSVIGDSYAQMMAENRWRRHHLALSKCSHVVLQIGSNDVADGRTLSQMQGYLTQTCDFLAAMGKKVILTTDQPRCTGTFTTLVGQTPDASTSVRLAWNAWRRTLPHPAVVACWDIAPLVSDQTDETRWRVDGGAWTTDGTHMNQRAHRHCRDACGPLAAALRV
jgi:hypothetical protein